MHSVGPDTNANQFKTLSTSRPYAGGIVPHFTGPISTAALVHTLGPFSGPVLIEYNYQGRTIPHVSVGLDFKNGKLYPNERPGLGVELDTRPLKLMTEITQRVTARAQTYFRPDGSITNW
jgi:galactonate dehydratase